MADATLPAGAAGASSAASRVIASARRTAAVERFFELSLLGMVASGFFAMLGSGELDWPSTLLPLAGLAMRFLITAGVLRMEIPARFIAALTFLYVCFVPLDYLYLSRSFLTAIIHMILFLAVVKVLTADTPRDYNYVKIIAVMELLAAALLSTHMSFFAFLAAFVLFAIATFSSGEVLRSTRLAAEDPGRVVIAGRAAVGGFPRRLSVLTAGLFAGILVMTAGMFFVLPRTARAALQRFVPERYHIPGFSNEVTLGEIGEIKQNNSPVMHIRSYEGEGLLAVRWRGAALTHFDGKRWFNPPQQEDELLIVRRGSIELEQQRHSRPGRSVRYEVQLNEIASDTLFFAGTPQTISIDIRTLWRSPEGAIRAPRFGRRGLRYSAYSFLEDERGEVVEVPAPLPPVQRQELLELPPTDPRIADLARRWTTAAAAPEDKARAIEFHLRNEYGYSLELLSTEVGDPLSYFLFERREGHCEYFASAMAVMLRSLGIPSRVATGFLSGVYNPMTGWQVVRASDAHSWVEAWIPGRGWTTFDPTPPDPSAAPSRLWTRMSLLFDAVDQFWRDWVVGYDFEHQVVLAARMQSTGREVRFAWAETLQRWLDSGKALAGTWMVELIAGGGLGVLALLFGPGWVAWARERLRIQRARRGEAGASDATLLYGRMLDLLAQRGFQKAPWITPGEFARGLPGSELAMLVEDMTGAYNQVRFGGQRDAAPRMVRLLGRIEVLTK